MTSQRDAKQREDAESICGHMLNQSHQSSSQMHVQLHSPQPMRLQRYIARSGGPGRRASEKLISEGHVRVNGVLVTQMGIKVTPGVDHVTLDGTPLHLPKQHDVFALNKPLGYECSMRPETIHPSAADLVPTDAYKGLVHVGRLDVATTGLILFTNDGNLCARLLMPKYEVTKTYQACIQGWLSEEELQKVRNGVKWGDIQYSPPQISVLAKHDFAKTSSRRFVHNTIVLPHGASTDPAVIQSMRKFEHIRLPRKTMVVHIRIHEGHNHEVRNMFRAVGHPVLELTRLSFGPIALDGMAIGQCKKIEGSALRDLYQVAHLEDKMTSMS